MISSAMFFTPGKPRSCSYSVNWKISAAAFVPSFKRLYPNNLFCLVKVVMYRLFSSSSNWCYSWETSNFENHFAPFNSSRISSTVGIGCLTLFIAAFAFLMSTQKRTPLSFLGTTTMGEIYSVALVIGTRLLMSLRCNCFNSTETFSRSWKGIRLCGWTLGVCDSLMFNFICCPVSLPKPRKTSSCLLRMWFIFPSQIGCVIPCIWKLINPSSSALNADKRLQLLPVKYPFVSAKKIPPWLSVVPPQNKRREKQMFELISSIANEEIIVLIVVVGFREIHTLRIADIFEAQNTPLIWF